MATEQQLAVAKEYFASNPSEGVMHISSDGQVFFQKNYNDGAVHQRRIDPSQKMTTIFRKDVETISAKSTSSTGAPAEDHFPTDKWTKEKIAEWLTAIGVDTTGKENKKLLLEMAQAAIAELKDNDGPGGDVDNSDEDEND